MQKQKVAVAFYLVKVVSHHVTSQACQLLAQ